MADEKHDDVPVTRQAREKYWQARRGEILMPSDTSELYEHVMGAEIQRGYGSDPLSARKKELDRALRREFAAPAWHERVAERKQRSAEPSERSK